MNPVRSSMSYVYVLRNTKSKRLYTGLTYDLRKRILEHETRKSIYTKTRGPYELVYYEACTNHSDAAAREKYLKSGYGKRYLNNRIKRFLDLTG